MNEEKMTLKESVRLTLRAWRRTSRPATPTSICRT